MKYNIDYSESISNRGNWFRMQSLILKAIKGENLTIGFLGGSITQGSLSSTPKGCYAYLVFEWFVKNFPNSRFTYVNAGIGATDSQFGVARCSEDLLLTKPDFTIIEFSVNDDANDHFMETYEGLVRKVYGAKNKPATMLVHNVFYHNGGSAQVYHSRVGRHYNLPSVSMQSSIYKEIVSGRIPNREITPDYLHPNDDGHILVASVITNYLEKVLQSVKTGKMDAESVTLPNPITVNGYENSILYRNYNSTPELNGFAPDMSKRIDVKDCFKNGWEASNEGDSISFDVEGNSIAVQYRRTIDLPAPIARLVIDGDEEKAVILDGNFDETWGDKLVLLTVMEHDSKKKHKVVVTIIKTHEKDIKPFYLASVIGSR